MQELDEQDISRAKSSFNDSVDIGYEEEHRPGSMNDGDDNDNKRGLDTSPEGRNFANFYRSSRRLPHDS